MSPPVTFVRTMRYCHRFKSCCAALLSFGKCSHFFCSISSNVANFWRKSTGWIIFSLNIGAGVCLQTDILGRGRGGGEGGLSCCASVQRSLYHRALGCVELSQNLQTTFFYFQLWLNRKKITNLSSILRFETCNWPVTFVSLILSFSSSFRLCAIQWLPL